MTTRRDFIRDAAWVAVPLVGGCRTFGDGEPLVRFVTFDPSGYPQIGVAIGAARQRA